MKIYKAFLFISLFFSGFNELHASNAQSMIGDLTIIKNILETSYAPAKWKTEYANWNLEKNYNHATQEILSVPSLKNKDFKRIISQFINSTQDHHVKVKFASTETAFLPFTVKAINGKYLVNWIDPGCTSLRVHAIQVGDELILFGGKPIEEVIARIKKESGFVGNTPTEQSLAEYTLTSPAGKRGELVPKGPILITVRSQEGTLKTTQLIWDHYKELIKYPILSPLAADLIEIRSKSSVKKPLGLNMLSPMADLYEGRYVRPTEIGLEVSFLPDLGEKVWDSEDENFNAYIYQLGDFRIGFIRIPHYKGTPEEIEKFAEIIQLFEEYTDGLVIDQLNNPGGYLLYQYALLSCLTDHPLETPRHRLSITPSDVLMAYEDLEDLENIQSDEEAITNLPKNFFIKNLNLALFLKNYCYFIINEWNQGRSITKPIYLDGVDFVNPHPKSRYTKPIILLINELDFSGGDFFPAILQDNKRATLFGSKTAGAGGCVHHVYFPSLNGIEGFSYTCSIAERKNGEPIENLGVTPDIEYNLSEDDIKNNYRDYINTLNEEVLKMLNIETIKEAN